ncbi:MAG TPA: V-type ATP synthase subunit B [Chthoniobacterales bacterium]|nr:V-type ATP synthase subunit B [Chthoniobacterales bacterium]
MANNQTALASILVGYPVILGIVGDIVRVQVLEQENDNASATPCLEDLAVIEAVDGSLSLAQVIGIKSDVVALQVFGGTRGISTDSTVHFLGHPMQASYSGNIFGRVFRGTGEPIDGGPDLSDDPKVTIGGPAVNPMRRTLASKMIRTNVPMIDVFNCLVESQKIPIFSVSGEPYNQLLAQIGIQADADVIVFGGMGLIFDDYYFFRKAFEEAGMFPRTVMFVNQASDPVVERLLIPDLALAVAENIAVDERKRVLVLLSDMTAFADALKEVSIAMDQVPANRGYPGDLYSQLASRYEKACDYAEGGSVTILAVTTMPGDDITHPVPDNTGYITEGQFYLHHGVIDPFGSLSRLKQHVIGKVTREDHNQIMNTMIRFYSQAKDAQQKQAMAFELSSFDQKLLKFGQLFRERFMNIEVSLRLEQALDLCWQTLAECFEPQELLMKQALVDKYYPQSKPTGNSRPSLSPDRATASPQTGDEDKNESSVSATANRQPSALNLNHG